MNSPPIAPLTAGSSTRPYLIRALHDWCTDNGFTPYVAVHVDAQVRVPMEYVKNNEIVLNVSASATRNLKIDNDRVHFSARFNGVSREVSVPIGSVAGIFARENSEGLLFKVESDVAVAADPAQEIVTGARTSPCRAWLTLRDSFLQLIAHLPVQYVVLKILIALGDESECSIEGL